ncbi:MAG: PAC2 family protein [Candidatus Thermoplasmatota archaeon]|nr:PAC2 family protein [Candidatus Thermoplasmatota archaeon]MBU4071650.1 PAC2 family protein [Candidatus Thermoplasmatota archaeon]MBU4592644.1 PAC2 family protein [Candidatus Thermoplasmatota archaeon]
MYDDIEIVERKDVNVKDALLIEGFPSVGMVSSIVANYLIKTLNMEYIGSVRSRHFQPTAIISDGVPMPPVRIYAGQPIEKKGCICERLVVVTSEFPPPAELIQPLADKILAWSKEKGIKTMISIEGIVNAGKSHEEHTTYAIASTPAARKHLENRNIEPLKNGIITGISGVLLHEAERKGRDVICLLSDANPQLPDARAAARLIEILDGFLPKIKLDPQPLIREAERLESQVKEAITQAGTMNAPAGREQQVMYG